MSAVNLIVVVESVRSVITHNSADDLNEFHVPSIVAVGAALGMHPSHLRGFLQPISRCQVPSVLVLSPAPKTIKSGRGLVGRPQHLEPSFSNFGANLWTPTPRKAHIDSNTYSPNSTFVYGEMKKLWLLYSFFGPFHRGYPAGCKV